MGHPHRRGQVEHPLDQRGHGLQNHADLPAPGLPHRLYPVQHEEDRGRVFVGPLFRAHVDELRAPHLRLAGHPGIESISKQYFYELAFKDFIEKLKFEGVKNAFLFPTYAEKIENKGYVELKMLHSIGLENIQVVMLPANEINQLYLENKKMDISRLNL